MRTHAEVHEAIEKIIAGTRLNEFMVTTNSFRAADGSVAVEWACCISGEGNKHPEFYFRSRDPDSLVTHVREGVERRRMAFQIKTLDSLQGPPPKDTALADPVVDALVAGIREAGTR